MDWICGLQLRERVSRQCLESERANLRRGATERQLTIATHIMTADAEEVQITVCSFIMTGYFLAD